MRCVFTEQNVTLIWCLHVFTFSHVEHCRPFADCELSKASEPPTHPKTQRHHARCTCGAGADTGANRDTGMDCLAMTCIVMNCVLSHLNTPLQMIVFHVERIETHMVVVVLDNYKHMR